MFIRTKLLILFLAIALVPLLFIGTLSFFTAKDALEKVTLLNLNAISEFRESELFLHLERLKTRTVDFSSDGFIGGKLEEILAQPAPPRAGEARPMGRPADREMLVHDLSRYLAEHKKILDPALMTVDVLGLDGRIIASSEAGRINTDRSKEWYFLNGQKRIYMEGLHREDGREFGLDIAAPIHRRGRPSEVTGVIVNHYDMSSVNEMMRGDLVRGLGAKTQFREIAQTGKTYLVNGDRFIIGGSSLGRSIAFQLKADTLPVRKCLEEGGELTGSWLDYRGVPVIGSSMCIAVDGLKWTLIIEQDKDEAFAVISGLGRFSMFSVAIVVFLISIIALSTAKMISDPISALHRGTEIIGHGNWDHKVGTGKRDEIGQLSRAFDQMVVNLKVIIASRDELNREIERRKAAEEEITRKTEQLARSNAELEQFAYVASHDLQEPLRMVTSYVQLLAKRYQGRLDADADAFIGFAVDGAKRMQNFISDLLAFSRVGSRAKEFALTDCEKVLDTALQNLQAAIVENHAEITRDSLPKVMADDIQIVSVFQNLIANAIKFRKKDVVPRVHISCRSEGKVSVFSVSDNGIGIAPEHYEKIFQIFQRLYPRDEYPGSGIGLSVCKKIVERHDGRIWVESQAGQGSTFYFTLPLAAS